MKMKGEAQAMSSGQRCLALIPPGTKNMEGWPFLHFKVIVPVGMEVVRKGVLVG